MTHTHTHCRLQQYNVHLTIDTIECGHTLANALEHGKSITQQLVNSQLGLGARDLTSSFLEDKLHTHTTVS